MQNPRSAFSKLIKLGGPLLLIDFLSKWWVQGNIPFMPWSPHFYPYGGIPVFRDLWGIQFSLNYTTNKGAAWGVLAEYQSALMTARLVFVGLLLLYLLFSKRSATWQTPLVLITVGALGNIVDYFVYGSVIDMMNFHFWGYAYPIFNIADAAIFFGVVWIGLSSCFGRAKEANVESPS